MRIFPLALALLLSAEPVLAVARARPISRGALPAIPTVPADLAAGLPRLPALPPGLAAPAALSVPGPKERPSLEPARAARPGLGAALVRATGLAALRDFVARGVTVPRWADQLFDGRLPIETRVEAAEQLGRSGKRQTVELLQLAASLPEAPVALAASRALLRLGAPAPRVSPAPRLRAPEPTPEALRYAKQPLYQSALKRVIVVSAVFLAIEAVGGHLTGSLSLKADAMHLGADLSISVGALVASWIARRPGSERNWLQRNAEPLVGFLSALAIGGMAVHMGFEAYERLWSPAAVPGLTTIALAFAGLASNVFATISLYRYRDESLSLKGAFLHAALDAVGSVGIIVAGSLIWAFGWTLADPIASFMIVALVLRAVWGLGKSSLLALLGKAQPR